MRIIAGSARRTALAVADESTTRPFLEMARGALFNSLGDRVAGAAVLDLYAGSGALGLEALSRGAATCVFVERDRRAFAVLERNIAACGFAAVSRALRLDVPAAVAGDESRYDLIFVDPPFAELSEWRGDGRAGPIMERAAALLSDAGVLVFRLEEKKAAPPEWPGLVLEADRRYGRSRVCRYARKGS